MRIAIMAAGGVGGFLGAKLARAGSDVAVVARGAHLAAIRNDGLTLTTDEETFSVLPAISTDDPAAIGPVDIVVLAVKAQDTESAAIACAPLIGPGTGIVPFLNGVEATDIIGRVHGPEAAMIGTCYIFTTIAEPGRIKQTGTNSRFLFGEMDGGQSDRSNALRAELEKAGVTAPAPADIRSEIWRKFVFLSSMAGMTAAARASIGQIRENPAMHAVFERAMAEVVAVALARGVDLPTDTLELHRKFFANAPYEARSSLANDLASGRRLEVDYLSGAVVRLGAEVGVDTPVHQTLHATLLPFLDGAAA